MPRRVNLPGAEELFRPTAKQAARPPREPLPRPPGSSAAPRAVRPEAATPMTRPAPSVQPTRLKAVADDPASESGRVKHDEKMTVYVTSDELMAVEQARLELRAALGRTVDRGRFVRAAVAIALADLDERGIDSDVARRLSDA